MTPRALTFSHVPDNVEALLKAHLPTSLPLLRRLQFAKHLDRISSDARVVLVSDLSNIEDLSMPPQEFTAVFVDLAGGPETQMWLYSTLEDGSDDDSSAKEAIYRDQLEVLVHEIVRLAKEYGRPLAYPDGVLLGTLNTRVRRILEKMNRIKGRETGFYDKWLFQGADFPENDNDLPSGLRWDTATFDDCKIVVDRTDIPRTPETLSRMPSLVIRTDEGRPVSWAFLGHDGSLVSLHCEEDFRRRGLAKTLAGKLMRQGPGDFATDGWSSADVAPDNAGSRGMCKSLKGTPHWEVSWVVFNTTAEGYSNGA